MVAEEPLRVVEERPAPRAATLSAEDYAVIDVVLTDLLTYSEFRTLWDHERNLVLFERKPAHSAHTRPAVTGWPSIRVNDFETLRFRV